MGDYSATVTDANGCTFNGSGVISQPSLLVATANITTGKGGNLVGGLKQPYTDKNLNKGWEGKQMAFNSTVINPAVEGPKLSKKYGKIKNHNYV